MTTKDELVTISHELKKNDEAIEGCASISNDKSKLLVGKHIDRVGLKGSLKAEGRDEIPSPYLNGMLDKYLDGKFIPAFETARGCPFLCTFCDQGLDETKITVHLIENKEVNGLRSLYDCKRLFDKVGDKVLWV